MQICIVSDKQSHNHHFKHCLKILQHHFYLKEIRVDGELCETKWSYLYESDVGKEKEKYSWDDTNAEIYVAKAQLLSCNEGDWLRLSIHIEYLILIR